MYKNMHTGFHTYPSARPKGNSMASTQIRRDILAAYARQWLQEHGKATATRLCKSNDEELITTALGDADELLDLYASLHHHKRSGRKRGRHSTYLGYARRRVRWQRWFSGREYAGLGYLVAARALRHANKRLAREEAVRPQ